METGEHISKQWLRNRKAELDEQLSDDNNIPLYIDKEIGVSIISNDKLEALLDAALENLEQYYNEDEEFTKAMEYIENLIKQLKP